MGRCDGSLGRQRERLLDERGGRRPRVPPRRPQPLNGSDVRRRGSRPHICRTHILPCIISLRSPDYATFSGQPTGSGQTFSFDAWRSVRNIAVDVAWYAPDNDHQVAQCNRVLAFFRGLPTWPTCASWSDAILRAASSPLVHPCPRRKPV